MTLRAALYHLSLFLLPQCALEYWKTLILIELLTHG